MQPTQYPWVSWLFPPFQISKFTTDCGELTKFTGQESPPAHILPSRLWISQGIPGVIIPKQTWGCSNVCRTGVGYGRGRGQGGGRGMCPPLTPTPPKNREIFFGKYHAKIWHFVNFPCIYSMQLKAKMSSPSKLTEFLRLCRRTRRRRLLGLDGAGAAGRHGWEAGAP